MILEWFWELLTLLDFLWYAIWGAALLWAIYSGLLALFKVRNDVPEVSPWQMESLDFDNIPGDEENVTTGSDK